MELGDYMSALGALLIVIVLIILIANIIMRTGWIPGVIKAKKNSSKRLQIEEVLILDTKRKLILIKRDDKEHLLLLGGDRETLVEENIKPPKAKTADTKKKLGES